MSPLEIARDNLADAERDYADAQWCDDLSANLPGGVLDRAWARLQRCRRALADAELAEALTDPAFILATSTPEART